MSDVIFVIPGDENYICTVKYLSAFEIDHDSSGSTWANVKARVLSKK